MVGTTRFELATSPTPRVRSTRLSHVPTRLRAVQADSGGVLLSVHEEWGYLVGGTYSFGSWPPSPKKNSFICSTRNSWASRVQGCRRYSFRSIFWRSTHSPQAFLETFL